MEIRRPLLAASILAIAPACQEVEEAPVVLTQQQWKRVEKEILKEKPVPEHPIGAIFDEKIELIGFDLEPDAPKAGQKMTITWYWRSIKPLKGNYQVFGHVDSKNESARVGADHHPVGGVYKTSLWKPGQIIRDAHEITLPPTTPAGETIVYTGLYKQGSPGSSGRLPVKIGAKQIGDRRVKGPTFVVRGAAPEKPPEATVPYVEGAELAIDGALSEPAWSKGTTIALEAFSGPTPQATEIRTFHDGEAWYIGARLTDEHVWGTLTERDADTWTEEVFEIFFDHDGDGRDYVELQITPRNTVFDANFKEPLGGRGAEREAQINAARAWTMEGFETAVKLDGTLGDDSDKDKEWVVEARLPFASVPGLAGPGPGAGPWRANFYRFDRPEPKRTDAYAWSKGPRQNFHEVSKFGVLRFAPAPPTAPAPAAAAPTPKK